MESRTVLRRDAAYSSKSMQTRTHAVWAADGGPFSQSSLQLLTLHSPPAAVHMYEVHMHVVLELPGTLSMYPDILLKGILAAHLRNSLVCVLLGYACKGHGGLRHNGFC